MKKTIALLLAFLMLLPASGCFKRGSDGAADPAATEASAASASPAVSQSPANTGNPSNTVSPTDVPAVTDAPADADKAFEELDLDIFRTLVTSGTAEYNQYIAEDPAIFGISRDDVTPGWGSFTYDDHVKSMEFYRDVLSELAKIDRGALSERNRLGYDSLKETFELQLKFENYYYYDEPLEPMNGYHTLIPLNMICFSIRSREDVEDYMILMEDMARFIGEIEAFEAEKAEHGLFMTETALDQVVESCEKFAETGEDCFLISYFDGDVIDRAKQLGFTDAECAALSERNRKAVIEGILPAYRSLANTLEAHRGDCSEFVGAMARGEEALEYFKLKLQMESGSLDSPDVIESKLGQLGSGIFDDMMRIIMTAGYGIIEKLEDPFSVGTVQENVAWLEDFIKIYYPAIPEYSLSYISIPLDIAEDFSPAAYLTPAFDNYYNNVMLINPTSYSAEDIPTVGHETVPGHMFQFLYTRSIEGISLSQQVLEPTGYAEGWTEFTEYFISQKATGFDTDATALLNIDTTFGNVFLPAYVSMLVNLHGYDVDRVSQALINYGMSMYADIFYEYAVTMPYYAMPYAVGLAYMREIYSAASPTDEASHKAFFKKLLDIGPTYLNDIADLMK